MLPVDLDARWQILIIAKEVLKFAHYFDTPETHDEHNYINRHRHLIFIKWSLFQLATIELSKLFSASENQKFNMLKLLKKASKDGEYRTIVKLETEIV